MNITGDKYVLQSAVLRGQGRFDDAIRIIEENIDRIDPDVRVVAWLNAFKAAHEQGDKKRTKRFARNVAELDPDVPNIRDYL